MIKHSELVKIFFYKKQKFSWKSFGVALSFFYSLLLMLDFPLSAVELAVEAEGEEMIRA